MTTHPSRIESESYSTPLWETFDLVVVATHTDDLGSALAAARFSHLAGVRSLSASVDGLDAIVGPLVLPGETACWNCYRLRRLAHVTPPAKTHEAQAAWVPRSAPPSHTRLDPTLPLLGHLVALEALKILAGSQLNLAGAVMVRNLVSLETTYHAIIRMPWCEVCGGAEAARTDSPGAGGPSAEADPPRDARPPQGVNQPSVARRVAEARDPDELRRALDGWVDDHAGPLWALEAIAPDPRGPALPVTSGAVLAAYTDGRDEPWDPEIGSGRGCTLVEAMRGAAAEALERYSAMRYRAADLRRCTIDELRGDAIDPSELFFYGAERYREVGFPYAPYRRTQPLEWLRGWWVDTGKLVWTPALSAYLGFDAPTDEFFGQVTSNGLAAGSDFGDAAMRAVFELVERDAFMLTWLARLPARRIDAEHSSDAAVREVVRHLEQQGATIRLYLLEVGHAIPVVACVSYGDGHRWPGAVVALGCHLSPRAAVTHAILEQGQVGPRMRLVLEEGKERIPSSPDEVLSPADHALYYFPPERARAFDFLRCAEGSTLATDAIEEPTEISLAECAHRLLRAGLRPAVVDVTSPDLVTGPFRVARALGPWFQPLDFGHHLQRLANPRLGRLTDMPNPDPHPLA